MAFFIIIQLSVWISQFIRYFLDKEVYPRTSINKGIASTFSLMIRYTFIVIGFVLALAGAGLEYSKIAIGMGALGIGIGFGLQNIVNNFMSGIILAIERPIKIGDIVKVGEIEGEVKDIGLRASQIKTWDGADVIVPNGSLISEKLINWTLNDRNRRLEIEVKLDLESDVLAASQVILDTANTVPKVLKNPKPSVNFEGIKDGAAVIKVYAWINNYSESFTIGTSFKIALYHALISNGFKLANPILDVNVNNKKASPEQSN
jgi:small-conductance mechanosensitive channel